MNDEERWKNHRHHIEETGSRLAKTMVHVLETGLEYMQKDNPTGKPAVKGLQHHQRPIALASDGSFLPFHQPRPPRRLPG